MTRNYPISADVFYSFCMGLFLLGAGLSASILWASLRDGDENGAWISAAYFALMSLLAILFWWLL